MLRLSWTNLSGPVPSFLSQLTNLDFLDLSFNDLTGSIPPELATLPKLSGLRLDRNKLTGVIPESFGMSTGNLQYLYLSHNQLTGDLPRSLGYLNFTWIDFSRNQLTGDLSMFFGANKTIQIAVFSRNSFQFNFSEVEFPASLTNLDLNHNKIYGSLPATLTGISLLNLNVSYNRLCGRIPEDLAFVTYGPYWKFMKKIVMSQLLNGTTLDLLHSVRQDEINRFAISLSQNAKDGKAVDVSGELVKTTNNVISRMIMNERCSDNQSEAKDVRKLVAEINEIAGKFNLSDHIWLFKNLDLQGFGKKLKDVRGRYDELLDRIIREHEEARRQEMGSQRKDLLNILLDISEDESTEIELSKENIKALILNMFTAGTDTSALTIEWAFVELINHPNIMKKAIQEIDNNIGKNRLLEESDIPNLPYLQSTVKETLRLHAAGPFILRKSTKDCIVAEYQMDVRGQHFQMLPVASGWRMCSGTSLALLMVQRTLGVMIQCFEWKAGKYGNLTTVDMEERATLTIGKANPLVCVPVARLDSIP
ncbi:hypothetical protein L1987_50975 [Smallanthus sonchifolius]|uniref:Uncharacterized protein n=1 Tax=Smallanthus sonchifolius TaxID=185202 RepID=A0ACB9EPT2_9ASTR|nr:hypothetical protein L1987_50975 [Smallanthus sonchifolius]